MQKPDEDKYSVPYMFLHGKQTSIPIGEGETPYVIDRGFAGHHFGTALPGQIGNFSLAGHIDIWE